MQCYVELTLLKSKYSHLNVYVKYFKASKKYKKVGAKAINPPMFMALILNIFINVVISFYYSIIYHVFNFTKYNFLLVYRNLFEFLGVCNLIKLSFSNPKVLNCTKFPNFFSSYNDNIKSFITID